MQMDYKTILQGTQDFILTYKMGLFSMKNKPKPEKPKKTFMIEVSEKNSEDVEDLKENFEG